MEPPNQPLLEETISKPSSSLRDVEKAPAAMSRKDPSTIIKPGPKEEAPGNLSQYTEEKWWVFSFDVREESEEECLTGSVSQ